MQIEAYLAGDALDFSIDELDFEGFGGLNGASCWRYQSRAAVS